ncbi:MAG: DUF4249 domain-containing protein [Daejeonella sp.]|uniref:DUF4249 domain-containing protein n=1 Tax=Daejeonella sp. TaxID=2805397 RepID=UPI003C7665C1
MNKVLQNIFYFTLIILGSACKEPYNPPAVADAQSYLVVEGFINIGGETNIILSRSTNLKDTTKTVPERRAIVFVENEQNGSFILRESSPGKYTISAAGLTTGKKYRVRIKTTSSEYLSDFVDALQTPEIDSLNFKIRNDGVQFYSNTHDGSNKTKYYRWEYDETWRYASLYNSTIEYISGSLERRLPGNQIFYCWRTNFSNDIILGSSANLSSDVIVDNPLTFIPAETGKVTFGYSILARQYALTKDAYEYWQTLKKNTEQLGSIFDPQPSLASGNIKCISNKKEPVIGYISASSVTSKRLFFSNNNFPFHSPSYLSPPPPDACEIDGIIVQPIVSFASRAAQLFKSGDLIPLEPYGEPGQGIISYTYARKECVDCRVKGGTNIKPTFWP